MKEKLRERAMLVVGVIPENFDELTPVGIREYKKVLQALLETRNEALEKALQHCHGVVMDSNKKELGSDYDVGFLHGAIACENGVYSLKTGEGK